MGFLYLDDSKHPEHAFCISALVYVPSDPHDSLAELLKKYGLTPGIDEFKSSSRMDGYASLTLLRDELRQYLMNCKVGLAVSRSEVDIAEDAAMLLEQMMNTPGCPEGIHEVYCDEGLFKTLKAREAMNIMPAASRCRFHFEQDSREILGIQLADLAAHSCALMLKDSLGLVSKTVKAGENSGYDPDLDIELGFVMYAAMRYCLLGHSISSEEYYERYKTIDGYGLFISPKVTPAVREAGLDRFARIYIGCIH